MKFIRKTIVLLLAFCIMFSLPMTGYATEFKDFSDDLHTIFIPESLGKFGTKAVYQFESIEIDKSVAVTEIDNKTEKGSTDLIYEVRVNDEIDVTSINLKFNCWGKDKKGNIEEGSATGKKWPLITLTQAGFNKFDTTSWLPSEYTDMNIRTFDVPFDKDNGSGSMKIYFGFAKNQKEQNPNTCTILFKNSNYKESSEIISYEIKNDTAQWMKQDSLLDDGHFANLIVSNNTDKAIIGFTTKEQAGLRVSIDGKELLSDEGSTTQYTAEISASQEGITHTIMLYGDKIVSSIYTIKAFSRLYDGLPDKVVDYLCVASQYTNGMMPANVPYGIDERAVATLRGGAYTAIGDTDLPTVSLGNFGGYVTYYYRNAILDNPKNPYGIDFIVYGNSVNGKDGFAEPGNILVSEDGETWYNLAGSLHYDSVASWNYTVDYQDSNGKAMAVFYDGTPTTLVGWYPKREMYKLCDWDKITYIKNKVIEYIKLSGVKIDASLEKNEYGNTLPVYPAFGYADCGLLSDSNEASNPYTGLLEEGRYSGRTDGFDLAWAVDGNGNPVELPNGIHFIKVQTASFINNASIGEKSTEVNMVRIAKPSDTAVGKTPDAKRITIDGTDISLESGKYEYEADVNGIFDVQVDAAKNSNIYINSIRGNSANFKEAAHNMVRIIIQNGNQEPVIYYITINNTTQSEESNIIKISLDAKGGQIGDMRQAALYFDKDTSNKILPIPTRDGYTFEGWYTSDTSQMRIEKYNDSITEDLILTARWKENNPQPVIPSDEKIKVTFRLIGSTLANPRDVDLSDGKEGFCGAKYVTWIPTRAYTMPKGSTIYDLFVKAMSDAGLKEEGSKTNYVRTIYAPSSLGGYALSEMTNGKYSGWMYTMNGEHTDAMKDQIMVDGAEVIWHYVNDYRFEIADWDKLGGIGYPSLGDGAFHNSWLEAADTLGASGGGAATHVEERKDVTTSGSSGSATTTAPTEVKVSGTTAAATVKAENQSEILKQAVENKSAEIVLEVAASETKGADSVQLSLDVTFVKNVADKTNADLTVNTENGKVTLDQETIKTVLAEAKGSAIIIEIAKVSKPTEAQKKAAGTNGDIFKLVVKSGDKIISEFNKGKATVRVEIPAKLADKKVAAIHIADDAKIEQLAGRTLTISGKKFYEFTTPHFSTFALVDAEELGLEVEETQVDAKALTAKLTPVARSAKTAKKNVKVTVSLDKQDKAIIKELKGAGYTVKYRFYRSTKKAAGYKAAVTKKTASYTNTSGKKGTKYFYKVQVRVYDENGKLTAKTALKQCKYASRTWAK